jgi:hypothetical protein
VKATLTVDLCFCGPLLTPPTCEKKGKEMDKKQCKKEGMEECKKMGKKDVRKSSKKRP